MFEFFLGYFFGKGSKPHKGVDQLIVLLYLLVFICFFFYLLFFGGMESLILMTEPTTEQSGGNNIDEAARFLVDILDISKPLRKE